MSYTIDELYEMLGGESYYSKETIFYIYHMKRDEPELAQPYLQICLEQNEQILNKYSSMKSEQEIKDMSEPIIETEPISKSEYLDV